MIYQPYLVYDLYRIFGASTVRALRLAASDYAASQGKEWAYYVGVALGYAALATGIKGAASVLHIVARTFDQVFFQSPNGSIVRIFIDGILRAEFSTYSPTNQWVSMHFDAGIIGNHEVRIINYDVAPENTTGIAWLALGSLTVEDGIASEVELALVNVLSIGSQDDSGTQASSAFYLPAAGLTLTQVQGYSDALIGTFDKVTKNVITGATIDFNLNLPAGLKTAAVVPSDAQRTALISMSVANSSYAYGQIIPGAIDAIFTGDTVNLANLLLVDFLNQLTIGSGAPIVHPSDRAGNVLTAAKYGAKSFRKFGKRKRK